VILILFIAAFLGSAIAFAITLLIAPAIAVFAAMFGGAGAIALAVAWMSWVQRRRVQGASGAKTAPAKADWAAPH
jgi:hypothetical protein